VSLNKNKNIGNTNMNNHNKIFAFYVYKILTPLENLRNYSKTVPSKLKYFFVHTLRRTETYKWDKKLKGLLSNVPESKHALYTTVLKNQRNYLEELAKWPNAEQLETGFDFVEIAKLVLDQLTIMDIINVQPMTAPVGQVYMLQCVDQENEDGSKRLSLEVVKGVVEAQSRKFAAKISLEASADLNILHGLDLKSEMQQAIAAELSHEIITEHLNNLRALAKPGRSKGNTPEAIILNIQRTANDIAMDTRRGVGNFVVMSPVTWSRIVDYVKDIASFISTEDIGKMSGLLHVGTMNSTIKIYVDLFGDDETILVGYKGSSEIDGGYIWSPYIMIVSSGLASDPETFQPMISLMKRSGLHTTNNASDYYRTIKV